MMKKIKTTCHYKRANGCGSIKYVIGLFLETELSQVSTSVITDNGLPSDAHNVSPIMKGYLVVLPILSEKRDHVYSLTMCENWNSFHTTTLD